MGQARQRKIALGSTYGTPSSHWAWDYTMGMKIPHILSAGQLQDHCPVVGGGIDPDRDPVIWFTTSDRPDPSSAPALTLRLSFGGDMKAFKILAGGFWRIGLPVGASALVHHPAALLEHLPSTRVGRRLRPPIRCGENRKQWWVALSSVPVDECTFQEQLDGQWVTHSVEALSSREPGAHGYGMATGSRSATLAELA